MPAEVESESAVERDEPNPPRLPAETPDWGIKLLDIMQMEFHSVSSSMRQMEVTSASNSKKHQNDREKVS